MCSRGAALRVHVHANAGAVEARLEAWWLGDKAERDGEVATARRGACHGVEAEHDIEARATQLDGDGLGFGAVVVGWSRGGQGPPRLCSRAGRQPRGRGVSGTVPPWPYFGHGEHTQCMCGTEVFPSVLGSVRRRSGCVRACVRVWDVVEPRAWPHISPSVENVTA